MKVLMLSLAIIAAAEPEPEEIEEIVAKFLRANQPTDALSYLEELAERPNLAPEQKAIVLCEQGFCLIYQAARISERDERLQKLADGRGKLARFVADYPRHRRAADAHVQLGNANIEIAKDKLQSASPEDPPARFEAQQEFEKAVAAFRTASEIYGQAVEGKDKPQDPDKAKDFDRLMLDYMQAKLLHARALYEAGAAYPAENPLRQKQLRESIKELQSIYQKWRDRMAGLYALVQMAQAHQKLGEHDQALEKLSPILTAPRNIPALRTLRGQALAVAMGSWLKRSEFAKVVDQGEPWLEKIPEPERARSENLDIREAVITALQALAKQAKTPERRKEFTQKAEEHQQTLETLKKKRRIVVELR